MQQNNFDNSKTFGIPDCALWPAIANQESRLIAPAPNVREDTGPLTNVYARHLRAGTS